MEASSQIRLASKIHWQLLSQTSKFDSASLGWRMGKSANLNGDDLARSFHYPTYLLPAHNKTNQCRRRWFREQNSYMRWPGV